MKKWLVAGIIVMACVNFLFVTGCAKKSVVKQDAGVAEEKASAMEESAPTAQEETIKETLPAASAKEKPLTEEQAAAGGAAEKAIKAATSAVQDEKKLANIHFEFDSYNLKPEAREILKGHAAALADSQNYRLVIEGHCDERGTSEYNLALGERRAAEAMKYLVGLGVDEKRIKTVSYGKEMPMDPGHTEEAWAKNRRDNFVVTPQK